MAGSYPEGAVILRKINDQEDQSSYILAIEYTELKIEEPYTIVAGLGRVCCSAHRMLMSLPVMTL